MDFTLSPEQEALRDSVRRFCAREYGFEQRRGYIADAAITHWPVFAELGWLGAGLDEALGGYGGSMIENAVILEEMGRALMLEPMAGHVMALKALALLAPEAEADLIAALIAGEQRCALAHLELEGRGDPALITARAEAAGEGVRLSGAKSAVIGGARADGFLISAREAGGVSLFRAPRDAPGLGVRAYRTLDNHHVCDLDLDGVTLDASARVGAPGAAADAIAAALDDGIIALCAEALGAMDAALWIARDYLKVRRQFGVTLNTFQALQHRMADMLIATELARSMLYQGLAALDEPDAMARRRGVSAAKALIAERGLFVTGQAIQLHGGVGVSEENAIGHYYKRLFVISHQLGNADLHRRCFIAVDPAFAPERGV